MMPPARVLRVLVRGVGDIGSAVGLRLFRAGHAVAVHDEPRPTTTRRGMAFADAVFDGAAALDGVTAVRVDSLRELGPLLAARSAIAVLVAEFAEVLTAMTPDVLVDARVRKRDRPEVQRGFAPLTVGLGPNFVAGETTDLVVETSWEQLGQVLTRGSPLPFRGEPRAIAGHARDRYVYAPIAGTFQTTRQIGDRVAAGEAVARIDTVPLSAPLDGVLRGLTRDGVPVSVGTKVVEVDPRGDPDLVRGIGERPARIAEGIASALAQASGAALR